MVPKHTSIHRRGSGPIVIAAEPGRVTKVPAIDNPSDTIEPTMGPDDEADCLVERDDGDLPRPELDGSSGTAHKDQADEDEFERRYNERFRSIRSGTGLEVGILVSWPGTRPSRPANEGVVDCTHQYEKGWELSTCLSSDCLAPLFHGTQWAGTRVWRAAVVALEYLLSDEADITINSHHAVLELGCGLGVPGMVLHALRKCTVVLTDMGDLIPTVQQNLQLAFPDTLAENAGSSSPRSRTGAIEARELDWSAAGVNRLRQETGLSSFDVVLNCDCIFEPLYGDSWRHLLECQVAWLDLNPMAYVLTSVERRKFDGIEQYLQAALDAGLVPHPVHPQSFVYPPQVELYRLVRRPTIFLAEERLGQSPGDRS